jgi:hypothetical protein
VTAIRTATGAAYASRVPSAFPPDLTDDQLMQEARATGGNVTFTTPTYLEELNRRAVDRQTTQMIKLTDEINNLRSQVRSLMVAAVVLAIVVMVVAVGALVRQT